MEFDFTQIVQAVITLASVAITSFLIPWIKAKVAAENIEKAKNLTMLAVEAAEQIFGAGTGQQKYEYVVSCLAGVVKVDEKTLKNMIEAAVLEISAEI